MQERNRIGLLALPGFATLVACDGSGTPLPSLPQLRLLPPSTVAPAYRPANPGPVAAVERFLTAEVAGDFEASFTPARPSGSGSRRGVEGWVAEHYLVVPTIRGFQLTADTAEGGRAEVLTDLSFEAGLDQLVGLIPGGRRATWVRGRGGGRMAGRIHAKAASTLSSSMMPPPPPASPNGLRPVSACD